MEQTMQVMAHKKRSSIDLDDKATQDRLVKYGFDRETMDFGDFARKMEAEFGNARSSNMLNGKYNGSFPHEVLVEMFKSGYAEAQLKENFKADLPQNMKHEEKERLAQERYDALLIDLDGGYEKTEFKKSSQTNKYFVKLYEPPKADVKQSSYIKASRSKVKANTHSYVEWDSSSEMYVKSLKAKKLSVKEVTAQYNKSQFGMDNRHTDKAIATKYYRL